MDSTLCSVSLVPIQKDSEQPQVDGKVKKIQIGNRDAYATGLLRSENYIDQREHGEEGVQVHQPHSLALN